MIAVQNARQTIISESRLLFSLLLKKFTRFHIGIKAKHFHQYVIAQGLFDFKNKDYLEKNKIPPD